MLGCCGNQFSCNIFGQEIGDIDFRCDTVAGIDFAADINRTAYVRDDVNRADADLKTLFCK